MRELHFIGVIIMFTQKVYGMDYTCPINQKTTKVGKKKRANVMAKIKDPKSMTPLPLPNYTSQIK